MSALLSRLLQQLRYDRRPAHLGTGDRPARPQSEPSVSAWPCAELDDRLAGDRALLGVVRELTVPRPAALTREVLASAPRLRSVVLPEPDRLGPAVRTELDRRAIATVWTDRRSRRRSAERANAASWPEP